MPFDPRTPSLSQVIQNHLGHAFARMHVSMVARVEKYDASKQSVDVQPLVKERALDPESDEIVATRLPVITNVPLMFPGVGNCAITFPVNVGDTVLLVFSDYSLDVWLSQGGEVDPLDTRSHHLSDAVAIPGVRSFSAPMTGIDTTHTVIGQQGGTSDFVALAQKVDDAVTSIKTWLTTHTHTVATTGTSTAQSGTAAPSTTPSPSTPATGSGTVKVST